MSSIENLRVTFQNQAGAQFGWPWNLFPTGLTSLQPSASPLQRFPSPLAAALPPATKSPSHHCIQVKVGDMRYEAHQDMLKLLKLQNNFSCLLTQSGWWANSAEGQVLPQVDPAWQELADVKKNDDLYLCSITNSATLQSETLKAFSYF